MDIAALLPISALILKLIYSWIQVSRMYPLSPFTVWNIPSCRRFRTCLVDIPRHCANCFWFTINSIPPPPKAEGSHPKKFILQTKTPRLPRPVPNICSTKYLFIEHCSEANRLYCLLPICLCLLRYCASILLLLSCPVLCLTVPLASCLVLFYYFAV